MVLDSDNAVWFSENPLAYRVCLTSEILEVKFIDKSAGKNGSDDV
jgi:hypothetical protein